MKILNAASKTTPVDADDLLLADSAASDQIKQLSWANLKAAIKSYYDSVVAVVTNKDLTSTTNTFATLTTTPSSATPTPTGGSRINEMNITALAANATFGAPSGSPVNFNRLLIRIKDNGTSRTLSWNAAYVAGGVALPTATTISKIMHVGFIYNTDNSLNKWMCVAVSTEA